MKLICSDLESVFTPEMWIEIAKKTGIKEFELTTRDISDSNKLMKGRIELLNKNNIKIQDLRKIVQDIEPFKGAKEFLSWLRSQAQVIILSETFIEFTDSLMEKLGRPTLLCHNFKIGNDGTIEDYEIRLENQKQKTVEAFKKLNFEVIAFGDSYNDINMLKAADAGFLFQPPKNITQEFPEFPVARNYNELKKMIEKKLK